METVIHHEAREMQPLTLAVEQANWGRVLKSLSSSLHERPFRLIRFGWFLDEDGDMPVNDGSLNQIYQ